jgi:hypothetical protein
MSMVPNHFPEVLNDWRDQQDVDTRDFNQPADETQDQEWLAFLAELAERDYQQQLQDPAYLAWLEVQAAIFAGETV